MLILVLIVALAVLGSAVAIVSNQPVDAFLPAELSQRYDGIERSISREGYPRLGNPDAPVTIEEYSSFACPGCEAFHRDSFDAVLERVRDEQVLFTYVPLNTGSIPNAPGASRAALCAGRQGMFWEMHDVLFDWQTRYGNTAFSQNRLLTGVENLGLNSSGFTDCFNSAETSATLDAAANAGVATTPTLRVNGVTVEASQGGAIPSAATILAAIDAATPDGWGAVPEPTGPEPADAAPADETVDETADDAGAQTDEEVETGVESESEAEVSEEATTAPSPDEEAASAETTEVSDESDRPADLSAPEDSG